MTGEQQFAKCFCAWCQNPIEFPADHQGELAPCPHCQRNTPLRVAGSGFQAWQAIESRKKRSQITVQILALIIAAIAGVFIYRMWDYRIDTLAFILVAASPIIYFLPSVVGRKKRNFGAILILNLFLGWTVVGWVAALVWAVTKEPGEK